MDTIFYGWWIVLSCFTIGLYVSSILFFRLYCLYRSFGQRVRLELHSSFLRRQLAWVGDGYFRPLSGIPR